MLNLCPSRISDRKSFWSKAAALHPISLLHVWHCRILSTAHAWFGMTQYMEKTDIPQYDIPPNTHFRASHAIFAFTVTGSTHWLILLRVPKVDPHDGSITKWTGEATQHFKHACSSIWHLLKNAPTLHDNLGLLLLGDDRCRPRVKDQILQETKRKDWHAIYNGNNHRTVSYASSS